MKKFLFSVILAMFISGISYSQELLWSQSENANGIIMGVIAEVDTFNNIYVGAHSTVNMHLLKYDQYGMIQFIVGADSSAILQGMFVSKAGKSYQIGSIEQTGTKRDGLLHVYEPNGAEIYTQHYNYANENDGFRDIFVDDNNYAYVTGSASNATDTYALTIKYSPAGAPEWIQLFGNPPDKYQGLRICVNSSGEAFVVASKKVQLSGTDILVIKYDAEGSILHKVETNFPAYDYLYVRFALLDDNDNIFVGGTVRKPPLAAGFIIKVTDDNLIWSQIFTETEDTVNINNATFDEEGNIIVAGFKKDENINAYYAKISATTGETLYEKTFNGSGASEHLFMNVASRNEYVYFCGYGLGYGTGVDYIISKVNSDGEMMWDAYYRSPGDSDDIAYGLVLDYEDNVIVTGRTTQSGALYCTTVKFSNPLGINEDVSEKKMLEIYPNPARTILHINYEAKSNASYTIRDINGKILSAGILNNIPNQGVDIGNFANGIYLISIEDGLNHLRAKFVKH